MKNFILLLFTLTLDFSIHAQTIKGKVTNDKNEPLMGANIFWYNTSIGTFTNKNGEFEIKLASDIITKLIASFAGYINDTIEVKGYTGIHIKLSSAKKLSDIIVTGQKPGQYISNNPRKTEVITSVELKKTACCDLAGCFNTSASVQPATTNVVTNAQELRILGLSGVYNQVLLDGFPLIQGLSYTYGVSAIPGPLVENIYVSKGANSVLQGWESISGQINVETKAPDKADKLFLNAYLNSFGEKHFNSYYTFKKKQWSNLLALHIVQPASKWDRDKDNFLDLPLLTRYEIYNKFQYGVETDYGWSSLIGVRFTNEKRIGGQTFFNPAIDKGSISAYGQTVNINQPEFYTKTAYRFDDSKRVVVYASAQNQNQNSWYGLTGYDAKQTLLNTTLQFELKYKGESNFKTGISHRYFNLNENILFTQNPLNHTYAGNFKKLESITGLFAEHILYFGKDKFTWITGARLDHHNRFGFIFTPRTLLKYSPTAKTSFRASAGYGWRTVNIFSENIFLLASQRDIIFNNTLQPEKAWNTGFNFTQKFEATNLQGYFSADYYYTRFLNQIFPDYNTDSKKAYIDNYAGLSVSNGFQTELHLKFFNRLDLKTSYNFLDVYRKTGGQKKLLPFNSRHKILNTISFKPLSNKWHIDANFHWYGEQQLPNTSGNPPLYQRASTSKPYSTINTQFTYNFKKFELYAGCENIFNFRQKQPIVSWQNPFSPYFDISSVWGPTRGREIYFGIRYFLK